MGTEVRPVRFQSGLLEALETRLARDGRRAVGLRQHGGRPRAARRRGERRLRARPGAGRARRSCTARASPTAARCWTATPLRARAVIDDLVARGARIIDLYESVLAPALGEIGELWALEQVTVADEHYATEETAQMLTTLAPERRVAPTRGRLAVVGGSPDELHAIGARMVADLLERAGWEVIALGAVGARPTTSRGSSSAECPDVVALSTTTVGRLPGAEEAIGLLRRLRPRPLLAVGGGLYRGPVVDLARAWGADLVTSDLRRLPRRAARSASRPRPDGSPRAARRARAGVPSRRGGARRRVLRDAFVASGAGPAAAVPRRGAGAQAPGAGVAAQPGGGHGGHRRRHLRAGPGRAALRGGRREGLQHARRGRRARRRPGAGPADRGRGGVPRRAPPDRGRGPAGPAAGGRARRRARRAVARHRDRARQR